MNIDSLTVIVAKETERLTDLYLNSLFQCFVAPLFLLYFSFPIFATVKEQGKTKKCNAMQSNDIQLTTMQYYTIVFFRGKKNQDTRHAHCRETDF